MITAEQIRDLRENGPRTIAYLNNCDMALAALRGEFGAGVHRGNAAIAWCAEAIAARAHNAPLTCSRCGCPVHQSWDHLSIGEAGESWTCDRRVRTADNLTAEEIAEFLRVGDDDEADLSLKANRHARPWDMPRKVAEIDADRNRARAALAEILNTRGK